MWYNYLLKWLNLKRLAIPQVSKDIEQLDHSLVVGGDIKCHSFENSLADPYKTQYILLIYTTTWMNPKNIIVSK